MSLATSHPPTPGPAESANTRSSNFASTQWSVVLSAAKDDPKISHDALETLCRAYWQPLYGYVRRSGRSREEAEDLVQGFFQGFLAHNSIAGADRQRGRFRAFLLACLKNYMLNEWNRERRQKRGGNATHLSLDWRDAETRYQLEPAETSSPDRLYAREWALALLDQVLRRLREESASAGKPDQFDQLKAYLTVSKTNIPYEQAARDLNMTEGSVRVAVHRLRKRYRTILRDEVGRTLASREQLDDEMRALFAALSS